MVYFWERGEVENKTFNASLEVCMPQSGWLVQLVTWVELLLLYVFQGKQTIAAALFLLGFI